jgi:hypothetical protein
MISMNIIRRAGVLIAGLSAALILAACSSGGGSVGGGGAARAPLPPRQALLTAATQAQRMTSFTELVTTQATGIQKETSTGTIRAQLKPTLRFAANLTLAEPGGSAQVHVILAGAALYTSGSLVHSPAGKPWGKIDLSALKGPAAARITPLVHSLQSSNLRDQTELLTVATNTRVAGRQTIAGVSTTEYACSINAAEAQKTLPAGVRKALAPQLQALGNNTISFHIWIDGQNDVRKYTDVVTANGETVRATATITALNQPVHITPPPASQTASLPGL